jgi:beta-glucosidase
VSGANDNTVVVLHTGSAVEMPWAGQPKAIVEAWYQGQSTGTAIAAVLFGDTDPAGRLPLSFPVSLSDTPTANDPMRYPGVANTVTFSEGLLIGYRWYDAMGIKPLFPFGHGLSYARIKLSDLRINNAEAGAGNYVASANVENTSDRSGSEVIQLYVSFPASAAEPPRQLKAFAKVSLSPGEARRVEMRLNPRDFAYWNSTTGDWTVDAGSYTIRVGTSAAISDLHLSDKVSIASPIHLPASAPVN